MLIHTELMLSGAVAQYGRGVGMIQATAAQIIGQFAGNLRAQLAQQQISAPSPEEKLSIPLASKPIAGLSLFVRVIWSRTIALFGGRLD